MPGEPKIKGYANHASSLTTASDRSYLPTGFLQKYLALLPISLVSLIHIDEYKLYIMYTLGIVCYNGGDGGMTMLTEIKFTEARNQLSSLYDSVFNTYTPAIIKRKQSEEVAVMRVDLLKGLLSNYNFDLAALSESDGSITLSLDCVELYANADNLEQAMSELVDDLKSYATEFIERSQLFFNAPNRREHFPYLLRVLLCENDTEIRRLLVPDHAS